MASVRSRIRAASGAPTSFSTAAKSKEKRNGCPKGFLLPRSLKSSISLQAGSSYLNRNHFTDFMPASGQAVVEFTLVFLLFLVIAWIPADFGLAFYTGQLAQNASREGARIAAADPALASGTIPGEIWTTSCTMPSCSGNILNETAARISSALLPGATINVTLDADSVPQIGRASCRERV